MPNKYWYLFQKDKIFRLVCILSLVGVVLCLVLIRLCVGQHAAFKDIQDKQSLIAQIPMLEAKNIHPKVVVKGMTLTLNGIISNKAKLMAVINNTFLKVGDRIEGKEVETITTNTVTLCDIGSDSKCIKLFLE